LNRDRFILSAGHASALLYSLLHLTGYSDCTLTDLKNFRQLHSKTAGHPEFGFLSGIETTTGPLGQGIANSVGMAIAERKLNSEFGSLIDYKTYCLCGDGCLMEGIALESLQLAGHLNLSNLVLIYDKNNITIDGDLSITSSVDYPKMFESFGFNVVECDGHNFGELEHAFELAQKSTKPTVIIATTKIGFGSAKEGTSKVHGSPLSTEEITQLKKNLGIDYTTETVPLEIISAWREVGAKGNAEFQKWNQEASNSPKKALLQKFINGDFKNDIANAIETAKAKFALEKPTSATRVLSGVVLEELSTLPFVIGGSADLSGSNNTKSAKNRLITKNDFSGNYIAYGVREHAMAGIMNGLSLSGFLPFGGTFLVFSDYMRNSIRLSALMKTKVFYVMTHDSIGLGEDGPTHQPVEHLASLRAIPNLNVFRPCDAIETANCFALANELETPSLFALSRQNLPFVNEATSENPVKFGGYIVYENTPQQHNGEILLESDRCYFRQVEEKDFANWLALGFENEHNEWTSQYSTAKNSMEENIRREMDRAFNDAKSGFYCFMIFEKGTDEFIGLVNYKPYQDELHYGKDDVDIGWAIMQKFQNKGIATEVAKVVMDFSFKNCDFNRLQGTARPENIASNRIFEKIGMKYTATYEEYCDKYAKNMDWNLYRMDRTQFVSHTDYTIIATGSEVGIAIEVAKKSAKKVRVVSVPCLEIFRRQSVEYQQEILGNGKRVFVEAGLVNSFWGLIREGDLHFTVDTFGHSGKAEDVYAYFGITAENILSKI
jgi:transketolase